MRRSATLLFVYNIPEYFLMRGLSTAIAARAEGFEVHVATPEGPATERIRSAGFDFHPIPMSRSGLSPPSEIACLAKLIRLYRKLKPDLVHHSTIKPVVYGGIAARLTGVPAAVHAIHGLGYVFTAEGAQVALLRRVVKFALRKAFGHRHERITFLNHEDSGAFALQIRGRFLRGCSMLEIVQITKYYPPYFGGVPNYVRLLAEELKKQHRVTVLASNTSFSRCEEVDGNLRVIRVPRLMELRSTALCPTLPWELSRLHPDIVHLHFPDPMAHLAYAVARVPARLVITWHSDIVRQRLLLQPYRPFLSGILDRVHRIIVSSPVLRDNSVWLKRYREKCVVIPFGVNLSDFESRDEIEARKWKLQNLFGDRVVLFIGRLVYYKGLDFLLRAMQGLDATLWVIGCGPLEVHCRKLAAQLGLQSRISFLGAVPEEEKLARLHACSLLALPSVENSETFGIVQLEAMACAKPVVSTDLPTGVPWVNQDGRTGFVVPPCNPPALRSAIRRLLDNPALQREFGDAGRQRVESEFTNEIHVRRMLGLYEGLLNGTARLREAAACKVRE
jgi:rhamnosyl/mannosyltransferase